MNTNIAKRTSYSSRILYSVLTGRNLLIGMLASLMLIAAMVPLRDARAITTTGVQNTVSSPTTNSTIVRTTLTGIGGNGIRTPQSQYTLAPECRFYLRNGGAIKPINGLGDHIGEPIQLRAVDGKAVWVVVEAKEDIR